MKEVSDQSPPKTSSLTLLHRCGALSRYLSGRRKLFNWAILITVVVVVYSSGVLLSDYCPRDQSKLSFNIQRYASDKETMYKKREDETTTEKMQHSSSRETNNDFVVPNRPNKDQELKVELSVWLHGELGNHLNHISMANAMKWNIEEGFASWIQDEDMQKLNTRISYLQHELSRGKETERIIQNCMPNLATSSESNFHIPSSKSSFKLGKKRSAVEFQDKLRGNVIDQYHRLANRTTASPGKSSSIRVSFLDTDGPLRNFKFLQPYRSRIKKLFQFDFQDAAGLCCKDLPYPNETVLHIRSFGTELGPKAAIRSGFRELDPERTANDLLRHLKPNVDSVAILSRFPDSVAPYVEALRRRKLNVRIISNQTAEQDFCFLLKAKSIAGGTKSTYFVWAAYLGEQESIYPYVFHTPKETQSYPNELIFHEFNYLDEEFDPRLHVSHYCDGKSTSLSVSSPEQCGNISWQKKQSIPRTKKEKHL